MPDSSSSSSISSNNNNKVQQHVTITELQSDQQQGKRPGHHQRQHFYPDAPGMEFRPTVRSKMGVVASRPRPDERKANLGDNLQRRVHYHSEGGDTLFGKEHQVDDAQRDFLSVEPRVLVSGECTRGRRRGQGLWSKDIPVARIQVDAGGLGVHSGTLFVFGGHQQAFDIGVDIDGNFFAENEITTRTGEQQTAPPPRSSVRETRF